MSEDIPYYKTEESRAKRKVKNVEYEDSRELRPGEKTWLAIAEEDRPKVGDEYKGVVVADFCDRGYPIGVNSRNLVLGTLAKGNKLNQGKGRPKGSRNKLTQQMLNVVSAQDISPAEFLALVMSNPDGDYSTDQQVKAAMKLTDIVYPKAASIELEVVEDAPSSQEEIDKKLRDMLSGVSLKID